MVKPRILTIVAFAMITLLSFTSCVKDDDSSENPLADAVVIGEDGQTSNGSRFISCGDRGFFLDSVLYEIYDAHISVAGCGKLTSGGEVKIFPRITYKKNTYDVALIVDEAFKNCANITSVVIPASVVTVGHNLFNGCLGLERIVVESGNTMYDSRDNCNAIIETATNKLMCGCKTSFIPDGVTSIEGYAFSGCTGLTSIEFPNSVTSIGDRAFWGCSSLRSITIPEGVTQIGIAAFYGCSSLTSITIPASLANVGNWSFERCPNVTEIHCLGTMPPFRIDYTCFDYEVYSQATLYVPQGCKKTYENASGWNEFRNIVEE